MIRGGSSRFVIIAVLGLSAVLVPLTVSNATVTPTDNLKTLNVSIPGPFNGCTYLNTSASPSTDAILDLTRPSAFLTNVYGNLVGTGGPIASAELTSLSPETVQYTIAANQKWSNGVPFTGNALVYWWHRARRLASIQSDGYRWIKAMGVSNHGLTVTVVFSSPYADWNMLFRDVEALGSSTSCSMTAFLHRPTLGPYKVASAGPNRVVLVMNKAWPSEVNRFGRIVISDSDVVPKSPSALFVNYTLSVDRAHVQTLSSRPTVLSHIGSSSNIEELTFGPRRPLTRLLAIREALSWTVNRQDLLNQLWGSVTFSPSIAASALYSQGQGSYPGGSGNGPSSQTTTSTTTPSTAPNGLVDCLSCGLKVLRAAGFTRSSTGWRTSTGQLLRVRVTVGPSGLDQRVAQLIFKEWARIGIPVVETDASSEVNAARAAATNHVDVAIFSRPTTTAVSYTARSWSGPAFPDSYPSGVRTTIFTKLFDQGVTIFNPVTASATWLTLDQDIMNAFWVRPLFTAPSLLEWSYTLSGVFGTSSIPGLLDQLPSWTTVSISNQG